jgi:tetratricopeptide (TPR) repeat protein
VLNKAENLYLKGADSAFIGLKLFDQHRPHIELGQSFCSKANVDESIARISFSYGTANNVIGLRLSPSQHLSWLENHLRVAKQLGNESEVGIAQGNMGVIFLSLFEPVTARQFLEQALRDSLKLPNKRNEATWLCKLGECFILLDELDNAIECFQQSLLICKAIHNRRGEGNAVGNLGTAYALKGERAKAIESFKHAIGITAETGDRQNESVWLGSLACMFDGIDQDKALTLAQNSLKISRDLSDRKNAAKALGNISIFLAGKGNYSEAIKVGDEALIELIATENHLDAEKIRRRLTRWKQK